VLRALSKDLQQRFSTITEFADALERASHPMRSVVAAMQNSPAALPLLFPTILPPTSSKREVRRFTPLVGVLGIIIMVSGLIYFASSHRALSEVDQIRR
jgi:hypothetical protein